MNNQNSEKENPSIYFSPTRGKLPPIEKKDMESSTGVGKISASKENTSHIDILNLQNSN